MHHHSWKILWQLKIRTTSLGQQTARHTKHHLNQLITFLTIPLSSCTTAFWTSAKFWMQTVGLQADSSTVGGVWRVHSATWPNQQQFGAGSSGGHGLGHSLAKNSSSSHVFSENPQRSRGTQESTVCMGPWNADQAIYAWTAGGFSKTTWNKGGCGYKKSHKYISHCT